MRRRAHLQRTKVSHWIETLGKDSSPLTGAPLAHKHLTSNLFARRSIAQWQESQAQVSRRPNRHFVWHFASE